MAHALIISSDSHVFEPPDLWTTRIDAAFRDRAPHMQRLGEVGQLVVEGTQAIAGIGLISNAGARFAAPETISAHGRFDDVHQGGYNPHQHLHDMRLDGVAGEVLDPSQGLFYFTDATIVRSRNVLLSFQEDAIGIIVSPHFPNLVRFWITYWLGYPLTNGPGSWGRLPPACTTSMCSGWPRHERS